MEDNIEDMQKRHKKEITELQEKCKYGESHWAEEYWAPGHFSGNQVRVCDKCNKILEKRESTYLKDLYRNSPSIVTTNADGTKPIELRRGVRKC